MLNNVTHILFSLLYGSWPSNTERMRVIANISINTFDQTQDTVDNSYLKRRSTLFKALGDKNRLKLLYILSDGEKCVSELLPYFEILQPTVSVHLFSLQDHGLLKVRRHGRKRYYSLASKKILNQINNFCYQLNREIITSR